MDFSAVNWIAVAVATIASFALGAVWYMALSKQWLAAIGKTRDQINSKDGTPYIWSVLVQLVMAVSLAIMIPRMFGTVSVNSGLMAGFMLWFGFIITTLIQNHRYEGAPWARTFIDGGYMLGVLLVQGIVIGLFGSGATPAA
ncbi:MAG TPA: DUF1761 domain-containing protein [Devosia sp.]|nr:DUF1761 domain-containing protein [Devosia sp.]